MAERSFAPASEQRVANRGCELVNVWSAARLETALKLSLGRLYAKRNVKRIKTGKKPTEFTLCVCLCWSSVLPDRPEAGLEDERCPLMTGCDRAGGQCMCDARHSCLGSFTYPDRESCMKPGKSGEAASISDGSQSTDAGEIRPQKCPRV